MGALVVAAIDQQTLDALGPHVGKSELRLRFAVVKRSNDGDRLISDGVVNHVRGDRRIGARAKGRDCHRCVGVCPWLTAEPRVNEAVTVRTMAVLVG
jgi:hypothetical protein